MALDQGLADSYADHLRNDRNLSENSIRAYLADLESLVAHLNLMNITSFSELDLNQRLFGKFKINNIDDFWDNEFTVIPKSAIYPKNDDIEKICNKIKMEISKK